MIALVLPAAIAVLVGLGILILARMIGWRGIV